MDYMTLKEARNMAFRPVKLIIIALRGVFPAL